MLKTPTLRLLKAWCPGKLSLSGAAGVLAGGACSSAAILHWQGSSAQLLLLLLLGGAPGVASAAGGAVETCAHLVLEGRPVAQSPHSLPSHAPPWRLMMLKIRIYREGGGVERRQQGEG